MLFEEAYLSKDVDSCKKNADGEGDIVSSVLYLFMNINNMFYYQPKKVTKSDASDRARDHFYAGVYG